MVRLRTRVMSNQSQEIERPSYWQSRKNRIVLYHARICLAHYLTPSWSDRSSERSLHGRPIQLFFDSTNASQLILSKAVVCTILLVGLCIIVSLLLMEKSNPCSIISGFPPSLSLWPFTICPTPYIPK